MQKYSYIAVGIDGKRQRKVMEASSPERVKALAKLDGEIAIGIQEASALQKDLELKKITIKDLAVLCQQMHSILKAGVPAADALGMVAKTTHNSKLKRVTFQVVEKIKAGTPMSTCMSEHEDVYPAIMTQMIKAGEASGSLDEIFGRLGTQFEKSSKTRNAIKKALAYPKVIIAVVAVALVIICAYIVPMFVEVFNQLGADIPITTKFFILLSNLVTKYWYIGLTLVIFFIASWVIFSHSEKGKRIISIAKLKIPLFKQLEEKTASANLARTMSTLLKAGLDYVKALEIASDTMDNVIFKESLGAIAEDIKNGVTLNVAIRKVNIFPELLVSMIDIGENTGNMETMLENCANYFEDEVESATVALTSAIQPIVIVLMGIIVGAMVYSIYMPMFSMYGNIK